MVAPMGTKRGQGRGSFVESVLHLIDDFYEGVVQNLKEWTPAPPRMKSRDEVQQEERRPAEEMDEIPAEPASVVELADRREDQEARQAGARDAAGT